MIIKKLRTLGPYELSYLCLFACMSTAKVFAMEITKVVEKKSSLITEAVAQVRTAVVGQQQLQEIEPDSLVTLVSDHQVVRMINDGALEKLKTASFNSTGTDYHERPFLFCGIATGTREIVEYLVKKGADINSKYLSQNVLHYAAALGHNDIVVFFFHVV